MDTRGARHSISFDFGLILESHLEAFWAQRLEVPTFSGVVSRSLFVSFEAEFGCMGLLRPSFRMQYMATPNFHRNRLLCNSGLFSFCFSQVLGQVFSDFCCLGNRLEQVHGFSVA